MVATCAITVPALAQPLMPRSVAEADLTRITLEAPSASCSIAADDGTDTDVLHFGTYTLPDTLREQGSNVGTVSIDPRQERDSSISPTPPYRAEFQIYSRHAPTYTVTVPPTVTLTASGKEIVASLICAQLPARQDKGKGTGYQTSTCTYTNSMAGGLRTEVFQHFAVGGRVSIPASQATGSYRGTFNATVSCS